MSQRGKRECPSGREPRCSGYQAQLNSMPRIIGTAAVWDANVRFLLSTSCYIAKGRLWAVLGRIVSRGRNPGSVSNLCQQRCLAASAPPQYRQRSRLPTWRAT